MCSAGVWKPQPIVFTLKCVAPTSSHDFKNPCQSFSPTRLNDSRFSDSVGQSGHFLSPHYDDALEEWRQVRHKKMRMKRGDIEAGALGTLTLTPR